MKRIVLFFTLAAHLSALGQVATNRLEKLRLEDAIALAESNHPRLAEALGLADAAAGRAQQAGTLPNPEIIGRIESAPFRGDTTGNAEYLAGVAQTFPAGRRLSKAREVQDLDRVRLEKELETIRSQVRQKVHGAYATALYQDRAYQARAEIMKSSERAVRVAEARVAAGDAARDESARAQLEALQLKLEYDRSRALRESAFLGLAREMGLSGQQIESLDGRLDQALQIPALQTLVARIEEHPSAQAADAALAAREAAVALARSERIPDVRVEALYRRIESEKLNTFDLGLSIPLPLFDRNKGSLRAARAEATAAQARARLTRQELASSLQQAHAQLKAAVSAAEMYQRELLPRAELVRNAYERRYAAGDISLSDVLPVRQTWADLQLRYLESLYEAMQAWGDLKFLATP